MNNKANRERIANLKWNRRLDAMGLKESKLYGFKSNFKPCSCSLCINTKYSRKKKHKLSL